jgi:thioester reductase-like protein
VKETRFFFLILYFLDVVFHCAAGVNHILPYQALRKQNVVSAKSVLEFCAAKPARLNFVSTISAVPNVAPGSSYDDALRYFQINNN